MTEFRKTRTIPRTVKYTEPSTTEVDQDDEKSFIAYFNVVKRPALNAHHAKEFKNEDERVEEFLRLILGGTKGVEGEEPGSTLSSKDGLEEVINDLSKSVAAIEVFNKMYLGGKLGN